MEGYNRLTVNRLIENCQAFVFWRQPGKTIIQSIILPTSSILQFFSFSDLDNLNGFVFAPFRVSKETPIYFFPDKLTDVDVKTTINNNQPIQDFKFTHDKNCQREYENKVRQILQVINEPILQKAVLTRFQWFGQYNFEIVPELFEKLCEIYTSAFVYQLFIPGVGYWIGASPELLFESKGQLAYTVSLAATQSLPTNSQDIAWNQKEKTEQELVSMHIRSVLKQFSSGVITEKGPETYNVGSMVHLRTIFEFDRKSVDGRLGQFLSTLHPTPAVCGLPVEASRKLLLEIEDYHREYYTGFLGNISTNENSCLYVNLRCMQAFKNGVSLYAGGGITLDSDPEKEWKESQLKIQTLLQILEKTN